MALRDSEVNIVLKTTTEGGRAYDETIAKMEATKLAARGLSSETETLGKRQELTRAESQKLADTLRSMGTDFRDSRAVAAALSNVMGETGRTMSVVRTEAEHSKRTFADMEKAANGLAVVGFGNMNLRLREAYGPLVDAEKAIRQVSAAANSASGPSGFLSGIFAALTSNTTGLNTALQGLGGGQGGGGNNPIGAVVGGFGAMGAAIGGLPLGLAIPLLVAAAGAVAILAVNLGEVVLAFAAMAATLAVATGALVVFGAAMYGVLGVLALAAGPIIAIAVALGTMQQSQATAAQAAATQLQNAQAAYISAANAVVSAQNAINQSTAVTSAQTTLAMANQRLALAQHNLALRPGSIGAQGAVDQATIAQQNAQVGLTKAQTAQQQQIAALTAAQDRQAIAARNLQSAQDAVAKSNQALASGDGSFKVVADAINQMKIAWVNAAGPALDQIAAALLKVIPIVQDLGLSVIQWFTNVIGPVLQAAMPVFNIFVDVLKQGGTVYVNFVAEMLARTPALTGILREFGKFAVMGIQGFLDNGIRLVDWFTNNWPKLEPIIMSVLAGFGTAIQGAIDGIANFMTWLETNWTPVIRPVFEAATKAIADFFRDLMKPDGGLARFIIWLDKDFPDAYKKARGFLDQLGFDISRIGQFLDGTGKAINTAWSDWTKFWNTVGPIFAAFRKGFEDSFRQVIPTIQLIGQNIQPLMRMLGVPGSGGLIDMLATMAYWFGRLVGIQAGGFVVVLTGIATALGVVAVAFRRIADAFGELNKYTGLLSLLNRVSGGNDIGQSIGGHASGGIITGGTPGRDSVLSLLTPGEGILTVEAMRRVGVGGLNALNAGRLPAFAGGGLVSGGATNVTTDVSTLIRSLIATLEAKAMGTTIVNANAVDYRQLAKEITKAQQFAASTGAL